MVHTLPDYSTKYSMVRTFSSIDNHELAARLGSINTYDRRGNVVWYDDFEAAVLKWSQTGAGVGNTAVLSTTNAFLGEQSCKITTGNLDNNNSRIYKWLGKPPAERLGVEITFLPNNDVDLYELILYYADGTNRHNVGIRWDTANDELFYLNSANVYTSFATNIKNTTEGAAWYTLKLVADLGTDKYVRCMFQDQTLDLSTYAVYKPASVVSPSLYLDFNVVAAADNGFDVYADNFILTQNEP